MKKWTVSMLALFMLILFVLVVGRAEGEKQIKLPEDIPDFVKASHFNSIDWEKEAVEFGNSNMIGNEKKSGIIGANMPSLSEQKWMWHLWGVEALGALTVVGLHKESETVQPILTTGWDLQLGGKNNGADAHAPSSVKIPKQGEWAILLYVDEQLFDTVVLQIDE